MADDQHHPIAISHKIQFKFEAILWTQQYNNYQLHPGLVGSNVYGIRRRRMLRRSYYSQIYQRDHFFKGESIIVTCMTHAMFYAKGGWLRLNWKNGSATLIDNMSGREIQQTAYGIQSGLDYDSLIQMEALTANLQGGVGNEYIRGMVIQMDEEIKSFDCFAPVWNTGEWEKRTYEMDVRSKWKFFWGELRKKYF